VALVIVGVTALLLAWTDLVRRRMARRTSSETTKPK
jgi:hypothetical protein